MALLEQEELEELVGEEEEEEEEEGEGEVEVQQLQQEVLHVFLPPSQVLEYLVPPQ